MRLAVVPSIAKPTFTVSWKDDGSPEIRWESGDSLLATAETEEIVEAAGRALQDFAGWIWRRRRGVSYIPEDWHDYVQQEFERRETNLRMSRVRMEKETRELKASKPFPCSCRDRFATSRGRQMHISRARYGTHTEVSDPPDSIRIVS